MKESRIALRYAKALFDLAEERNFIEEAHNDMQLVHNICKSNRDFRLMLYSPIIKADKKTAILKQIFTGNIHDISLSFLLIITSKRRESYIEGISEQFIEYYREYKNIITAYLITAEGTNDGIRSKVLNLVKDYTKKDVVLVEEIKENIMGGFILKFTDIQLDESIKTKIIRLKREYNINIYEKAF
jgi:F-type H+-transporting ATPase subunit delta